MALRTWAEVMSDAGQLKTGPTRLRWDRAMRQKPFNLIRKLPLLETQPQHLTEALHVGTVATMCNLHIALRFAQGGVIKADRERNIFL